MSPAAIDVNDSPAALQPQSHATCASFADTLRLLWRGFWSRDTWTTRAILRLAAAFIVLTLCSWLGMVFSHQSEGVATIWLSNGILFGLLITRPRQEWLAWFLVGLAADTVADSVLVRDTFGLALGVSLANSVEVITSTLVLTRIFGAPLNLSRRIPLVGFLFVSVICATALCSAIGASWTLLYMPTAGTWLQMFRTWYLGDILGMALLAPLVFMLQRPGFFSVLHSNRLHRTLPLLALAALASCVVFTHSTDPLIFLLFPVLLLVVFRLGFSGTVLTIFLMAALSIGFTIKGYGPLMLIAGEHQMLHRIVIAQVFLAVAIFTTFPVAALLEERTALQAELAENEARYRRMANADELTGLFNRRAFNHHLDTLWTEAIRTGDPVAIILLDADFFKNYNDLYGHLGGDECLRRIADAIALCAPPDSFVARFGGEEFAVLLAGPSARFALHIAEEVRRSVFNLGIEHTGSHHGVQTVSLGVSTLEPRAGSPSIELLSSADRALYQAKALGRNRVAGA
jgi:diguanylate cyclase (GGDEF)-like protein